MTNALNGPSTCIAVSFCKILLKYTWYLSTLDRKVKLVKETYSHHILKPLMQVYLLPVNEQSFPEETMLQLLL